MYGEAGWKAEGEGIPAVLPDVAEEDQGARAVADDRSDRSTPYPHPQGEDHEWVEDDVDDVSGDVCLHGHGNGAVRADEAAEALREHGDGSPEGDDPEIVLRVAKRQVIGADEAADPVEVRDDDEGKEDAGEDGAVEAQGRIAPDLVAVAGAECEGDRGASAGAEEGSEPRQEAEERSAEGDGGDHVRVAGLPDKKDVGHVVEDHDDHDNDGRQAEPDDQGPEGAGPEHFFRALGHKFVSFPE